MTAKLDCKHYKKQTKKTPNLRRVKVKGTVNAGSHARENDSGIAFKAFSPTINKRNDRTWIQDTILVHQ